MLNKACGCASNRLKTRPFPVTKKKASSTITAELAYLYFQSSVLGGLLFSRPQGRWSNEISAQNFGLNETTLPILPLAATYQIFSLLCRPNL